uniref:hypothetical protein n=1 Tax=Pseudomonas amygdali TaxID=47877 RepID=UPI00126A3E13
DLPDRAGKTRACLTAGPNQPEHKKTDTPQFDKTIVSIPTWRLMSESFRNNRQSRWKSYYLTSTP